MTTNGIRLVAELAWKPKRSARCARMAATESAAMAVVLRLCRIEQRPRSQSVIVVLDTMMAPNTRKRTMHPHLYELAKRGAKVQLLDLLEEAKLLLSLFPHLRESCD